MLRPLIVVALLMSVAEGNRLKVAERQVTRNFTSSIDRSVRPMANLRTKCFTCELIRKLMMEVRSGLISLPGMITSLCHLAIEMYPDTILPPDAHQKATPVDKLHFCLKVKTILKPVLRYIFGNSRILTWRYAVSLLLQEPSCYSRNFSAFSYLLKLPVRTNKLDVWPVSYAVSDDPGDHLRILLISDVHLQDSYAYAADPECGMPLCCKRSGSQTPRGRTAGAWGDYLCDFPLGKFRRILESIRDRHTGAYVIDYIYFTGDIMDHSVEETSRQRAYEIMREAFDLFAEIFPYARLFPALGNHDTVPVNLFPPVSKELYDKGLSNQWLYKMLVPLWNRWLPKSAFSTVERQGYYAVHVNSKFKIISLNNNVAYKFNLWLLLDADYLKEQLTFLRAQLMDSEVRGQFVHILTHIPTGSKELIESWERNYFNLIQRFAHLIKGQFFGHSHADEIKIFRLKKGRYNYNNGSRGPGKIYGLGFGGGSLTPYQSFNPGYRTLTVNRRTYDVVDVDTWTFNLTLANELKEPPKLYKLYSLRKTMELEQLSPQAVNNYITNTHTTHNRENLRELLRLRVRDADPWKGREVSREGLLCDWMTTVSVYSADCFDH